MSQPHRAAVLNLYKTLLFLGREWPQGYDLFRKRLHKVFTKNSCEADPAKIETMVKHGEFVVKEIEALYKLKKYRTMKQNTVTEWPFSAETTFWITTLSHDSIKNKLIKKKHWIKKVKDYLVLIDE